MEICEKCGGELKAYYKWFCPKCEKPESENITVYNLFRCLYYIEAHGHLDFKNKFWEIFIDRYDVMNDSWIKIKRPTKEEIEDCNEYYKLISLIFEMMDIKEDSCLFEISW